MTHQRPVGRATTIRIFTTLLVCAAAGLAGCSGSSPLEPDAREGLQHQSMPGPGKLYLRPYMAFTAYRTVMLNPLVVTVARQWQPTRDVVTGAEVGPHPVSQLEVRHLEAVLGSQFLGIVSKELVAGGYRVVTRAGDDTLLVSPSLVDVYPGAPPKGAAKDPMAGTMTLVLDLSDAGTGFALARYVEEKRSGLGALEDPTSAADSAEYRQAVEDWARQLRALLDRMKRAREARGGY